MAFALSEIDRYSSRLGLPRSIMKSSSVIYRKALDNKLISEKSIECVVSASILLADNQIFQ